MTERTVQRYLKTLAEKGLIRRIGPAKGGHWEVSGQTKKTKPVKSGESN